VIDDFVVDRGGILGTINEERRTSLPDTRFVVVVVVVVPSRGRGDRTHSFHCVWCKPIDDAIDPTSENGQARWE
jgi:hypothetical protein